MKRLRAEFPGPEFDRLKPLLLGEAERGQISMAAEQMGLSEGALRVAVHRLRKRYREALWAEIAETVSEPAQIEEEIRYLLDVLASGCRERSAK